MSVNLQHAVGVTVSDGDNTSHIFFKRDTTANTVSFTEKFSKQASGPFSVLSAESKTLSIGDITSPARGLYLEVNASCSVVLSGAADPIILMKAVGADFAKLFIEAMISSVEVIADQGDAIEGVYCLWGDAVAP